MTVENEQSPNTDEMIAAIRRSGYLIESQISEMLSSRGFFVEANQVIKDPLTGKGREIDVLAEHYSPRNDRPNLVARIKFAFEAKNNPFPLVLLTRFEPTPNLMIYESLREAITLAGTATFELEDGFYGQLMLDKEEGIFSQYCTFKRKKDAKDSELMAFHPDELHDSLVKVVQYCDEQYAMWEAYKPDHYFRDFLYLPVVVLGGTLFELASEDPPRLRQVQSSQLVFNYFRGEEPKCATIFLVAMSGFSKFIDDMMQIERLVEDRMVAAEKKAAQKASPNSDAKRRSRS
jgi:hypothetical protein